MSSIRDRVEEFRQSILQVLPSPCSDMLGGINSHKRRDYLKENSSISVEKLKALESVACELGLRLPSIELSRELDCLISSVRRAIDQSGLSETEVARLGEVSRWKLRPLWFGDDFKPRHLELFEKLQSRLSPGNIPDDPDLIVAGVDPVMKWTDALSRWCSEGSDMHVNIGTTIPPRLLFGQLRRTEAKIQAQLARKFHRRGTSVETLIRWRISAAQQLPPIKQLPPISYFFSDWAVVQLCREVVERGPKVVKKEVVEQDPEVDLAKERARRMFERWLEDINGLLRSGQVDIQLTQANDAKKAAKGQVTRLWMKKGPDIVFTCRPDQSIAIVPDSTLSSEWKQLRRNRCKSTTTMDKLLCLVRRELS